MRKSYHKTICLNFENEAYGEFESEALTLKPAYQLENLNIAASLGGRNFDINRMR